MTEYFDSDIKYKPVVNNHSTTVFRKVSPINLATQIPLSQTSSYGPTEVILPPSVLNLSKSRINFQVQLPAPAFTGCTWVDANSLCCIDRVVLYDTNTNQYIADVSSVPKYAHLVSTIGTSYDEFMTKGDFGIANQLMPTTSAASSPYMNEDIAKNYVAGTNYSMAGTNMTLSNALARKQLYTNNTLGALGAVSYIDFSIPMSAFKFSALSLDKNIYTPTNLNLQIWWSGTDNFSWYSTSLTDPSAGATSIIAGAYINNFSIELASEGNNDIIKETINAVATRGLSIPIAYPTMTNQAIASSDTHSYLLSITRGFGSRILAIITAPFSVGQTTVNYKNYHTRGTLKNYNTYINNIPLKYTSGYDVSVQGQDWTYGNREYCKGSAISALSDYIQSEWVHVDSFVGEKPLCFVDQTEIDGLEVKDASSSWQIQAVLTSAAAAKWSTLLIGQKLLNLTSQGVIVLN